MQLSHLCFADDLIIFCKGDKNSINILMKSFNMFSKASELQMNQAKSRFYSKVEADLDSISGMQKGSIPFKYLGVTVSPKKLSMNDCACLVGKFMERIKNIGSRRLSYGCRLVLIKTVLQALHSYWARVFVIPTMVLKRIDALWRKFFWHGQEEKESPALVSWANICKTEKQRGLGLKDIHFWNRAFVGKYVWWIAQKVDHLWVHWVHSVYIKEEVWADYYPSIQQSWSWRQVFRVNEQMKQFIFDANKNNDRIAEGYDWLMGTQPRERW